MERLVRNPAIIWRVEKRRQEEVTQALEAGEEVGDRGTVILMISGMMHQLNLVGGQIWELCDGTRSLEDLVAAMAEEFEVSRDVLEEDVTEFVDDLVQRGWLTHG